MYYLDMLHVVSKTFSSCSRICNTDLPLVYVYFQTSFIVSQVV